MASITQFVANFQTNFGISPKDLAAKEFQRLISTGLDPGLPETDFIREYAWFLLFRFVTGWVAAFDPKNRYQLVTRTERSLSTKAEEDMISAYTSDCLYNIERNSIIGRNFKPNSHTVLAGTTHVGGDVICTQPGKILIMSKSAKIDGKIIGFDIVDVLEDDEVEPFVIKLFGYPFPRLYNI
jgi:hypothetical protein